MRISDWSSDVCSSDLLRTLNHPRHHAPHIFGLVARLHLEIADARLAQSLLLHGVARGCGALIVPTPLIFDSGDGCARSEEHTSELQSLMRISYAVFCLKKKTNTAHHIQQPTH